MKNFRMIAAEYTMSLTKAQTNAFKSLARKEDDDILIKFDESTDPCITEWFMDENNRYIRLFIEPDCNDDIPSVLREFEQAFIEVFGV
jgi:hypothetical protein